MYLAKVIDYIAEEDTWENGCIPSDTCVSKGNDYPFHGEKSFETCKELLEFLKKNTYGSCWYGFQDPYEENSKEKIIIISFYEDIDGNAVYENEPIWEDWKKGKARLWSCEVLIRVKKVELLDFENELEESGFETA